MLPRLAALNPVDCAFTHTKPATYGQARLSSAERVLDDAYFFFCELGRPVLGTMWTSSFGLHIPDVVQGCSKEEVGRIHAWRVVAAVANTHVCRYGPMMQLPGHAMRKQAGVVEPEYSIRLCVFPTSQPWPTVIRAATIHESPETLVEGKLKSSHVAPPCGVVRGRPGVSAPAGPVYSSTPSQPCEVHA